MPKEDEGLPVHLCSLIVLFCWTEEIFHSLLNEDNDQGPVVQSIVSLTNSLVVKMLPVLVSTLSNSPMFAEKMWMQKLLTFFQQKY